MELKGILKKSGTPGWTGSYWVVSGQSGVSVRVIWEELIVDQVLKSMTGRRNLEDWIDTMIAWEDGTSNMLTRQELKERAIMLEKKSPGGLGRPGISGLKNFAWAFGVTWHKKLRSQNPEEVPRKKVDREFWNNVGREADLDLLLENWIKIDYWVVATRLKELKLHFGIFLSKVDRGIERGELEYECM